MGGKLHSHGDWPSMWGASVPRASAEGRSCLPQQWFSEEHARAGWLEDEKQACAVILKLILDSQSAEACSVL